MLNTLRHSGFLRIELRDDLGVPGVVDPDDKVIYVDGTQSDDEILDVVNMAMLQLLRPKLAAVDSEAPHIQPTEEVVTPRPQLRLVRAGGDR